MINDDIDKIYHQQIIKLSQKPNFKKEPVGLVITVNNPMCGDVISIFQDQEDHFCWNGAGCMLCTASAEALCQTVNEIDNYSEVQKICTEIKNFFNSETVHLLHDNFIPFQSVKQVKSRINCVILPVRGVQQYLDRINNDADARQSKL